MREAFYAPRRRRIGALDWLLLRAISFYRKRISPRKGWRCAHGVLHGGPSCSGWVQNAIREHGARAAYPLVRQRFAECKRAAQVLRAEYPPLTSPDPFEPAAPKSDPTGEASPEAPQSGGKDGKRGSKCDWFDCCGCDPGVFSFADRAFDCGPADTGCIPCDCLPCG